MGSRRKTGSEDVRLPELSRRAVIAGTSVAAFGGAKSTAASAMPFAPVDETVELIRALGSEVEIQDHRSAGAPLPDGVSFQVALRGPQIEAFDRLAAHDYGVLAATTKSILLPGASCSFDRVAAGMVIWPLLVMVAMVMRDSLFLTYRKETPRSTGRRRSAAPNPSDVCKRRL